MTRSMADAISANAQEAVAAGTAMIAGYVTGTPDILWTPADWALCAGKTTVTIDQGYTGSPVATANVRDVEAGAWTPAAAVNLADWTAPRPTIYCSLSTLPAVEGAGWQGDVWVADWTGTPPSSPPAVPAGMTCVAVQYTDRGGGGAYDLSVVFDDAWPGAALPPLPPSNWTETAVQELPTLSQGMKGPFVSRLQGLLVANGYQLGSTGPHRDGIDGDFGPLTRQAVVSTQTAARIGVDGIVGQQTWPVVLGVA